MGQININIRMDEELKKEFEAVLDELGLSMTAGINIFARTVVRTKSIPFEISLKNDKKAIDLIKEVTKIKNDISNISEDIIDSIDD